MKRLCRLACYVSLAATLTAGTSAFADTFNFLLEGDNDLIATGTLTTIPDPNLSDALEIISVSGSISFYDSTAYATLSLLPCSTYSPTDPCGVGTIVYDNLLYPAGDPAFYNAPPYVPIDLDPEGLGLALSTGQSIEIGAVSGHDFQLTGSTQVGAYTPTLVGFTATQTPEPSTFILFAAGLLGIAATTRRRIGI